MNRLKVVIRGAVQGVGFRPFVHRLATELHLPGWVNNSSQGVFIEVEGARRTLDQFLSRVTAEKPAHSFIQSLESSWLDRVGYRTFEIRESGNSGPKTAFVLPDIGTCPDCLDEIFDPANRRYHYPFTNCTHCGPRFSIIEALPYDRANTSMKSFTMCPQCQAEYDDPQNRRFHAQPNACPVCGPHLELWNADGAAIAKNHDALALTASALQAGQIVAVRGVGGFHLMVDARDAEAVSQLRERKHRQDKPFALLFPDLEAIRSTCHVSPLEERLLCSAEAPIVLLKKRLGTTLADEIAPGNPNIGAMLPSNPLHHLLMAELKFPVVATSGNQSDEPICIHGPEALSRLRGIADLFLVHDRPIVRHVDDSIVRVMLDREMILRRARGYAPLPISLKGSNVNRDTVLAVGAHLKNSVALAVDDQVFISQHIGDLETEQANDAFRRVAEDLAKLYEARPGIVAADLHPNYLSTQFADGLTTAKKSPPNGNGLSETHLPDKFPVQHHVAHVLSCIAENEVCLPALGISWDGTGYGTDGTIWGGEFFRVTENEVKRIAHWRPFRLPGGEKAVKEPRRSATGLAFEMFGEAAFSRNDLPFLATFTVFEISALKAMLRRKLNSPVCSSVGRLFDAVAGFINLRQRIKFEGQAAMELEFAMDGVSTNDAYPITLSDKSPAVLDWAPMIEAILVDMRSNVTTGIISMKFHNALAEAAVMVAKKSGETHVVLSGGCFQNRYLTERTEQRLREENFQPYWHQRVPPNDGGICLGQVAAARWQLQLK